MRCVRAKPDGNNTVEMKSKQTGRRALLKAGLVALGGGTPVASAALATAANSGPKNREWWVRTVDHPTLAEKTAAFGRFSGDNIFEIYRDLKTKRDGAGSFEAEQDAKAKRLAGWMRNNTPGYRLPDHQLSEGAWTLMASTRPGAGLLSWTRVSVRTPEELGVPRYTASLEEAAHTVKVAARLYGAGLVGIAPMNETYVNLRQQKKDIVFEDLAVPSVTDTKFVIPKKSPGQRPSEPFWRRPAWDAGIPALAHSLRPSRKMTLCLSCLRTHSSSACIDSPRDRDFRNRRTSNWGQ